MRKIFLDEEIEEYSKFLDTDYLNNSFLTYKNYQKFLSNLEKIHSYIFSQDFSHIEKIETYKAIINNLDYIQYDFFKMFDIELTSLCSVACYGCRRYVLDGDKLYDNPLANTNQNIDYDKLTTKILNKDNLLTLNMVRFVGSIGDPALYPQLLDVIEHIKNINPAVTIELHTNGSLKNENFFSELGKLMCDQYHFVGFAIDGDENNFAKYRIGANWKKIMLNLKAFNDAGGHSNWKCINFSYNEKDFKKLKKISKQIGCSSFKFIENVFRPEMVTDVKYLRGQQKRHGDENNGYTEYGGMVGRFNLHEKKEYDFLDCEVLRENFTSIGSDGKFTVCVTQDCTQYCGYVDENLTMVNYNDVDDIREIIDIYGMKTGKLHFNQHDNMICVNVCGQKDNSKKFRAGAVLYDYDNEFEYKDEFETKRGQLRDERKYLCDR